MRKLLETSLTSRVQGMRTTSLMTAIMLTTAMMLTLTTAMTTLTTAMMLTLVSAGLPWFPLPIHILVHPVLTAYRWGAGPSQGNTPRQGA